MNKRRHRQDCLLGTLYGDHFWYLRCQDDVQCGDEEQGDDRGDDMGANDGVVSQEILERRFDKMGDGRFGEPAKSQAGGRDTNLAGGDKAMRRVERPPYGAGGPVAGAGQLIDLRALNAKQGELSGDEDAVDQDKRQNRHQFQEFISHDDPL